MKWLTFIYFLFFLVFYTHADEIKIFNGTKSLSLSKFSIQNKYKVFWKEKKTYDDLSQQTLTYKGYEFTPLLQKLQKDWNLQSITQIKVKAKDGYILTLTPVQFNSAKSFLALDVLGLSAKGLYVNDFKKYVDWKPSYLILDPKQSSSPYQVTEIELLTEVPISFNLQFPNEYKAGAKLFYTHCMKCHNYKNHGGSKGPPLDIVLKAWPSDEKLKTFIKDPLKYKNGNSGMSTYQGSDKSIDTLIVFLRYIENQNHNK